MKKDIIFFSFAFLLTGLTLSGQSMTKHNPALSDSELSFEKDSDKGTLSFTFKQEISDFYGYSEMPVSLAVCLLNVTPVNERQKIGDAFEWRYDHFSNCFLGVQNDFLYKNQLLDMSVDVIREVDLKPNQKLGFVANIQPAPCMNGVNRLDDDCTYKHVAVKDIDEFIEIGDIELEVFPNPFVDELLITGKSLLEEVRIEIFELNGGIIYDRSVINVNEWRIDASDFIPGQYMMRIHYGGKTTSKKFIKIN